MTIAYIRANRLTNLFCRIARLDRRCDRAQQFYIQVWYRTAGIPQADMFKV